MGSPTTATVARVSRPVNLTGTARLMTALETRPTRRVAIRKRDYLPGPTPLGSLLCCQTAVTSASLKTVLWGLICATFPKRRGPPAPRQGRMPNAYRIIGSPHAANDPAGCPWYSTRNSSVSIPVTLVTCGFAIPHAWPRHM